MSIAFKNILTRAMLLPLLGAIALLCPTSVKADKVVEAGDSVSNVCDVFREFPETYLALLPQSTRLDMLDYLEADSLAHVRNAFSGETWIEEYKPGFLKVHLTDVSTLTIKALKDRKQKVIYMAIYTIAGQDVAADSQLIFFDDTMHELSSGKFIKTPDPKHFWRIPDDKDRKELLDNLLRTVPFYAVEYTAFPDNDTLSASVTSISFLTEEQKGQLLPMLIKERTFVWNGRKFIDETK